MATKKQPEIWIGARRAFGRHVALAWVRWHDERLIDATTANPAHDVDALVRMAREAIAKRGYPPDVLRVSDDAAAEALRGALGDEVMVEVGFDPRAQELADAATDAMEVAFGAGALLARDARASQAQRMHARMHETVEAQLTADDPPAVRLTLERLQRAGLDRGAAVHAIAGVFMQLMHQVLVTGQPFDPAAYAVALDGLRPVSLHD